MTNTNQFLVTEDLTINQLTQQVTHNGSLLLLPDLSYRTLLLLIEKAPNTVSVDQLIENVWQDIEVSSETVTQRIALLRKSLNTNSKPGINYISSIRNKGYRWVPEVKTINKTLNNSNHYRLWMLLITVVLVIASSWFYFANQPKNQNTSFQTTQSKDEFLSQAWLYLNKHDLPSNKIALDLFRKSLANNSENTEAMIGISFAISHQVTKYNQPNNLLDEAEILANKAIKLSPNNADAWIALGFIKDARGEIDHAIELYKKGIKINPDDVSTKSSLAYLYSQKGKLVEAMKLNIESIGSKQTYLNLQIANTLELLGFDSVAEHWYHKADELSPDNVFVTHQLARFYISNDQNSKAKEVIESAMKRGIKRPELNVLLGIIELMNKDNEKAAVNFKNALKVDADDFEANIWNKIVSTNNQNSIAEKEKFEAQWLEESADWPDVEVFKALYLAQNNRFEESIQSLEKAYINGYINHKWLKKLPPFYPIKDNPEFLRVIETMQNNTSKQRQQLLNADWLPVSFLDPQKY